MGPVQRYVFIKGGFERAIHITRIGLMAIPFCSLQSLDMENAFNTISRRRFFAELHKNPDLPRIIPLVEMICSRDCIVNYFDPYYASLLYCTVLSRTGVRQGHPLGTLLLNLALSTPLRNIWERCNYSTVIQSFFDDGKSLITTDFVPNVIVVATEELGKVRSTVQSIKFSCMVPPDTAPGLVRVIRAKVPVVTGTNTLGAPLAMDFSMTDCPPAFHN
jgi:hypothetical protein